MRTIIVDFDGVIHRYTTPWINARTIPDPPVEGAIEWLHRAIQKYEIAILSSRSHHWGGRRAMRRWLKLWSKREWADEIETLHMGRDELTDLVSKRGLCRVTFPRYKPPAILTIDDRCFRFDGRFPTLAFIEAYRPWNRPSGGI
jgi:hypothetical protein